ncbi:hypothetical protein GWK47_046965 [Chionoecetes opilio]|uniref:Uncharacterized protein n=1 Tax=Chionoecetes opilio TaxID=41210 RepID=A0A8J4Y457_CHIOP|nr:hypothetical protein GWK47_046965 [Chionoecetes opilio]
MEQQGRRSMTEGSGLFVGKALSFFVLMFHLAHQSEYFGQETGMKRRQFVHLLVSSRKTPSPLPTYWRYYQDLSSQGDSRSGDPNIPFLPAYPSQLGLIYPRERQSTSRPRQKKRASPAPPRCRASQPLQPGALQRALAAHARLSSAALHSQPPHAAGRHTPTRLATNHVKEREVKPSREGSPWISSAYPSTDMSCADQNTRRQRTCT